MTESIETTPEVKAPKKKGNVSWKPAQYLDVKGRDPNFTYRYVLKDPARIEQKRAEGWILVDKTSGIPGVSPDADSPLDAKAIDSARTYREFVLMALPIEDKEARARYFAEQTQKQTVDLKANLERDLRSGTGGAKAEAHGSIEITRIT